MVLVLRASLAQNAHGETADPAGKLRPRNYNPHPYAIEPNVPPPPLSATSPQSANHVKRRQSPALYNQGPIQFPTNNDVSDNAPAQRRPPPPTTASRTDYDDYVSARHFGTPTLARSLQFV